MLKSFAKILATSLLLAPASVLATPITVDFVVTGTSALDVTNNFNAPAYNGYSVGTTGTGSFTIEDSIGNYSNVGVGLTPIDFTFQWLGNTFTEATAQLWSVQFDGSGGINFWAFGYDGGTCANLNCVSAGGPSDFYLSASNFDTGAAALHDSDNYGWMLGTVSWSVRANPVPEPATLSLLGLGLLGVAAARRKRAVATSL